MALSEIHNYYEDLVENYIVALELSTTRSDDYLADLYCLALNQLPVHYIRHGVDMYFYLSDEKRQEMEEKVICAVTSAISWLDNEQKEKNDLARLEKEQRKAEEHARAAAAAAVEAQQKAQIAIKLADQLSRETQQARNSLKDRE
ncbi:MAG: late competence development ComFB family protein [Succinivibrionaceae bacterium]